MNTDLPYPNVPGLDSHRGISAAPRYTELMMACRFSASDSACRTLRLPSTPLKLDTMKASVDQPGPCYTLTALLLFSWLRVESAKV